MAAPGLRLHPRTMQVQAAKADLGLYIGRWQQEHDLTDLEVCVILADILPGILKYPLRRERHPDDPEKKADEA